ncbi:MAG: RNA polymerase sigma factor [Halobacteriovoraceae bacterium]|jgi:RNA polymerase sigma-70 factor, ECF subfamily|nr:RNA polymerase sigma factor [Halobacteriovoraceae bacterium]
MGNIKSEICKKKRNSRNEFLEMIGPYRADLYLFCRKLTNSPWDAEDLAQETIMRADIRLSDTHFGVENIKSYLFKMASNQWIDWCRRSKVMVSVDNIPETPVYMNPQFEVKEALSSLIYYLPPKERVAIVLKDIFDFKIDEIKDVMETTTGAVKSALHRGREKMVLIKEKSSRNIEPKINQEHKEVVNKAVDFFNKRDINGFCNLLLSNATGNAYGCFLESSAAEIKKGSIFHTINQPDGTPQPKEMRAECVELYGENLFILWVEDKLEDIWRIQIEEGQISRFDCYYCCPKVLAEVAKLLGAKSNDHGYYYEDKRS